MLRPKLVNWMWDLSSGSQIGIGGHLAAPPSHTTGHTGPYHGGSTGLSFCGDIGPGQAEIMEDMVAQGVLDRGM